MKKLISILLVALLIVGMVPASVFANTYKVTFDLNGGKINGSTDKVYVSTSSTSTKISAKMPADPTKEGYVFMGWFTQQGTALDTTKTIYNLRNTTYYAKWGLEIKWNAQGGTITSDPSTYTTAVPYNTETTLTVPANVEKADNSFDGWFTAAQGGDPVTNSTKVKTGVAKTYYAHWTPYNTLTYEFATGTAAAVIGTSNLLPDNGSSINNEYVLASPKSVVTGYTFVGWTATDAAIDKTSNPEIKKINLSDGDKTVYGHWQENSTLNYAIATGTAEAITDAVLPDPGSSIESEYALADPEKVTGYEFLGWTKNNAAIGEGNTVIDEINLSTTGTYTVYGHWTKLKVYEKVTDLSKGLAEGNYIIITSSGTHAINNDSPNYINNLEIISDTIYTNETSYVWEVTAGQSNGFYYFKNGGTYLYPSYDYQHWTGNAFATNKTAATLYQNKIYGQNSVAVAYNSGFTGGWQNTVSFDFYKEHHDHNWSYSANDNVITAICSAENCPVSGDKTATLNAPANHSDQASLVYDGDDYAATVTLSDAWKAAFGDTEPTISYKIGGTETNNIKNAGTYTAEITVSGQTASLEYTIAKASQGNPAVTMADYTYAGTPSTPSITVADDANYKFYYSAEDKAEDGAEWTDSTGASLDAGDYYMYAVVDATDNYEAYTTATKKFTIAKADNTITDLAIKSWVAGEYDAVKNAPTVTSVTSGTTPTYKYYSDEDCASEVTDIANAAAGIYWVQATVAATNYKEATAKQKFVILPAIDVNEATAETSWIQIGSKEISVTVNDANNKNVIVNTGDLFEAVATNDDVNKVIGGTDDLKITLTVTNDAAPSNTIKGAIPTEVKPEEKAFYDVTLTKNGSAVTATNNGKLIAITLDLPESWAEPASGTTRTVYVVRHHEGSSAEELTLNPAVGQEGYTVDLVNEKTTLYLNQFSEYALYYVDSSTPVYYYSSKKPVEKPTTWDKCKKNELCPIEDFGDLVATQWYHDGIHFCLDNGLMKGVTATTFAPNATTTRAMMMTILARMDGCDTEGGEKWYSVGQSWAITNEISDGTNPDAVITREQFATMLYRYAKSQGKGFVGTWMFNLEYSDAADVSEFANEAIHWCVMKGILTGYADGTLLPGATLTRAEAATMIQRYCTLK